MISPNIKMEIFSKDEKIIEIQPTVEKNVLIVAFLISVYALSDCDSMPMLFTGKGTALKTVRNTPLIHVGERNASLSDVVLEGKTFVAKCYAKNIWQFNCESSDHLNDQNVKVESLCEDTSTGEPASY